MSRSTARTSEFFKLFSDERAALAYVEKRRWPKGVACPACGEAVRIAARKGGFHRCNACKTDFTVRTGTIFGRSHVPLQKWIYAMYLLASRRDISSLQLGREIGVTQKSAWFMLRRLREACGSEIGLIEGAAEVGESGGIGRNGKATAKPQRTRRNIDRRCASKTVNPPKRRKPQRLSNRGPGKRQ